MSLPLSDSLDPSFGSQYNFRYNSSMPVHTYVFTFLIVKLGVRVENLLTKYIT